MNTERKSSAPLMIALVSLLSIVLVGAYVWAYQKVGRWSNDVEDGGETRYFDSEWKAIIFTPAAKVESLLKGREVEIGVEERLR